MRTVKDLTGKIFGELTVIEKTDKPEHIKGNKTFWKCQCSCGNISVVNTSNLTNGHSTRCWDCAHYETNKHKRINYCGQTFGALTVLEMIYPERGSGGKRTKCKCKCLCGNTITRVIDSLLKSNYPSCGCKRHERIVDACAIDINNKKIGRLLILETIYDFENHTKPKVKCLCDCGKEIILFKNDVLSGSTKSCGCLRKEINSTINEKDWTNVVSDAGVKLLSFAYQNDRGTRMWNCECPLCKNTFVALPAKVMSCHTTSCGCKIESSLERITESILVRYNIKYIKQYSFDDCVYKYKLKFDFAILDNDGNVIYIIENDGKQHYESVEYFGGQEGFESTQIRDEIKNEYCKSHNIPLLRLPYYLNKEEIEKEIVNNLIVETAVG